MTIRDRHGNRPWGRQRPSDPFRSGIEHLAPLPCRLAEQINSHVSPPFVDFEALPAEGMTAKLRITTLAVTLALPDDCPSLAEIERLASKVGISLDAFISRAVLIYADEVAHDLANPAHFSRMRFPA